MSRHKHASDRKLAANRENSKKSTGPKTEEGKSKIQTKCNASRISLARSRPACGR
jgi:hypothetical protein